MGEDKININIQTNPKHLRVFQKKIKTKPTKDLKDNRQEKLGFLHMLFLENEAQTNEKFNTEQWFSLNVKATCKKFRHF